MKLFLMAQLRYEHRRTKRCKARRKNSRAEMTVMVFPLNNSARRSVTETDLSREPSLGFRNINYRPWGRMRGEAKQVRRVLSRPSARNCSWKKKGRRRGADMWR